MELRVRRFADNGGEFTGLMVDLWAYHHKVRIEFSRPGRPTDNAFIESFNGSLRDECLNVQRALHRKPIRGQEADQA
jgi:transposase InsO family protein